MADNYVMVHKETIDDLRNDRKFLNCLEEVGVDNWEGYEEAVNLYKSRNPDE